MKCSSCGRQRDLNQCSCGQWKARVRTNGDVGVQISLGKRRLVPRYVYSGGKLKKAD